MLIIGAQKAGTTSLYKYLESHPDSGASFRKEPRFYTENYEKGLIWYRGNFPFINLGRKHKIVFEASPSYIFYPHVPQRVAHDFPNIKIVALLRNPIHRAYSQYEMNVRHPGLNESRTFDEAVAQEKNDLKNNSNVVYDISFPYMNFSYLARGHYWEQLSRWYEVFPQENIKIIQSEVFFENTKDVYSEILEFLDLSPLSNQEFGAWNASSNRAKFREKIAPDTYDFLQKHFKPYNEILYRNLGQSFNWD